MGDDPKRSRRLLHSHPAGAITYLDTVAPCCTYAQGIDDSERIVGYWSSGVFPARDHSAEPQTHGFVCLTTGDPHYVCYVHPQVGTR